LKSPVMTQRTRIHLLRHGQVEGFEARRYNGQADVPLTPLGRDQSQAFALRLQAIPLSAVYSSDLSRSRYGAEQIASRHKLQVQTRDSLRELHIGAWEGLTWVEIQRRWPQLWQARLDDLVHVAPPGGESLLQVAQRVNPVISGLVAQHRGEEIAIVAHGGVNRIILLDAIGAPLARMFHLEQSYGCHNIIDYFSDGYACVQLLNGPNPGE